MKIRKKKYFTGGGMNMGASGIDQNMLSQMGGMSGLGQMAGAGGMGGASGKPGLSGGTVKAGITALGNAFDLDKRSEGLTEDLGSVGQFATGLISENPTDIMEGGKAILKSGFSGGNALRKNEYATDAQKFWGTMGMVNPALGMVLKHTTLNDLNKINEQRQDIKSDLDQRNQLLGLEDGGNLGNIDPRYAKLLPANFNFDPSILPDTALNQPPRVEYRISNKPIFTAKVGKVPDYEAAYPTEKRIEDSMNQQQKLYDQYIDNRGMLKDTTGFTQVAPGTYFNPTINRIFRASDSKDSLGIYGGFRIPKNDAQRRILSNIIKETRRNEPSVRKEIEQPIQLEEFTPKQQVESISLPKRGAPRDLKNMSPAFLQFIKEAQESDDLGPAETNPKKAKRYKQVKDISFADGGNLNYFDGGYTHDEQDDENIFEGIPQGRTPEGDTNVVEKGETRWQDYIFSDSLTLDKNMIKMLNLPKSYGNKTFAKISKNINKELEERPHDPYTKESVDRRMEELKQVNNLVANKENTVRMAKYGGTIKHDGGLPLILAEQQTPQYQGVGNYGIPLMQELSSGSYRPIYTDIHRINRINNFKQPVPEQSAEEETGPVQNTELANPDFFNPYAESLGYIQAVPGNVPDKYTRRGYRGDDLASQNEWVKSQLGQGNIDNWLNPESELNRGVPWRQGMIQEIQQKQPDLYEAMLQGRVPMDKLQELYTEKDMGPIQSLVAEAPLQKMTRQDPILTTTNAGLAPMTRTEVPDKINPPEQETPKETPPVETPETQGSPSKIRDYSWIPSMIGGAASFWPLPEVQQVNPTTMNVGQLNPQLVDEQTMRANIDAANRGFIGGLSGATGGSAAAQRAAMLGQGANYMDATSQAFLQGNLANNQARQQADRFNIGTQADVAARNMGTLNRADEINTGAINERNMQQYDTRLSGFQDMMDTASKKLQEKAKMDMFAKVHGYNSFGEYANAQQANRLKGNVTKPVSKYNLANLQSTVPVTNPVQTPIDTTPIISNQGAALPVVNPTNYFWDTGAIQQKCGGSIRTKRRSLM